MSNNFTNIRSIQGIQELDDSAAQSCVGGAFRVDRSFQNGVTISTPVAGDNQTVNLSNPGNPITGLGVVNTGGANGQNFQLTYRSRRGNTVGTEYITPGTAPTLYAGNGRLNTGRAVQDVVIQQYDAVDPGRLPLGIIEDAMQGPIPVRGQVLVQTFSGLG